MAGVKPPRVRTSRAKGAGAAPPAAAKPAPVGEAVPPGPAAPVVDVAPPAAVALAVEFAPRAGIEVTGPRAGRRRAGRAFGPTPVTLAVAELSVEALEAIVADPLLSVVAVEIEAV